MCCAHSTNLLKSQATARQGQKSIAVQNDRPMSISGHRWDHAPPIGQPLPGFDPFAARGRFPAFGALGLNLWEVADSPDCWARPVRQFLTAGCGSLPAWRGRGLEHAPGPATGFQWLEDCRLSGAFAHRAYDRNWRKAGTIGARVRRRTWGADLFEHWVPEGREGGHGCYEHQGRKQLHPA